jgi:hypothetical protein
MSNSEDELEVVIDFTKIGDEEKLDKGREKNSANKRELQQILRLGQEEDWISWLQSSLVKPWWAELWRDYLTKRDKTERSNGIGNIQAKIASGESNGNTKYSTHFPDKGDWDPADHFARFHYNVKKENMRSNEGVFYGRNFSETMD